MKKNLKLVTACLAFCILFACCGKFFHYILVDDTASYTRITFHEMYGQDNIDILFAGSSHCYRSFVPEILDRNLGANTFNAGTSNQKMDGSCMVIKEAAKYHDVKRVYLELFYNAAYGKYKTRDQMTETYIISDYMKPSWQKIKYLLKASSKQHYFNSFLPARRHWTNFFDPDLVKDLILKKQSEAYKNYAYDYVTFEKEQYVGKGYVANQESVKDWNFFSGKGWKKIKPEKFTDDWYGSLDEIMDFCEQKNIALTFIVTPMTDFLLSSLRNYDDYIETVRKIADAREIEFYDFNLCKEDYFPSVSELFKDPDHLNSAGAERFSQLFADFVNGKISEKDLFYPSYAEKLKHQTPAVFGISYHNKEESGQTVRKCRIVSNRDSGLEYEIVLAPKNGSPHTLQEFSENRRFQISPDESGVCTISYRPAGSAGEAKKIRVDY